MKRPAAIWTLAAAILTALGGGSGLAAPGEPVRLEVAGPPIDAPRVPLPDFYLMPRAAEGGSDGGRYAQRWAMLGREDRAAASASAGGEYAARECEMAAGSPSGWDAVIDAIAARAADHRVVIINESHTVSRHRETTRRLLARLRPLGFRVLAAETFNQGYGAAAPVQESPGVAWPRMIEGFYSGEPAFGRLVRDAKRLGYRLAPYEERYDPAAPAPADPAASIVRRDTAQARHLAEIVGRLAPDERLVVHAGYGHGSEVAFPYAGRDLEWMGARFKALTGIDPLTVTQTACRSDGGAPFLAVPPSELRPGQFDMVVSHPVDVFDEHRPRWRREAGDVAMPIPVALRPVGEPLVIEAFAWDEPFEAVPVDRVYVEPGEAVPLLVPPGRYRVRAVRLAGP